MKVLIDKSFEKDTTKLTDQKLLHSIADCIEGIQKSGKLSDIPNCKKLKGSKNAYRIRIGDYRIGFIFEKQTIELIRFLHRSLIYNFFPK
ncbi:MAG: type II toxin-antitoxin system RelE/ParE family toxin [Bacteroidota bacterium]|nr:type II toxin-antitoxin system RelE/ParE family toxin [Bacteroidota bacterium]